MNTEPETTPTSALDTYFSISKRKSRLSTELLAGVSTYLSLAYIFIVNPAILSKAGIDPSVALFATVVASGLSTLVMGLYARLPFALAPGLEMNGFVAFVVVGTLGLTWQASLGAIFWSGVLCLILSVLPVRERIVKAIPVGLQSNLAVSVGVFVFTIGLYLAKIVIFDAGRFQAFGSFASTEAVALYIGLVICFALDWSWLRNGDGGPRFRGGSLVPGSFLIAIVVGAVYCRANGITQDEPAKLSWDMLAGVSQIDYVSFFTNVRLWPVFLVLFMIDFYGSIGKFIGLTTATNLRDEKKGVEKIERAMQVDGVGTMLGASLGTTSIITYVESAVGIAAGGRTGIVAVVCGILMLASLLLTPLVGLVPVVATAGILVYVGFLLLPRDDWRTGKFSRFDLGVGAIMALISFFTFSLDKAMVLGFGAYSIRQLVSKEERTDPFLMGAFLTLLGSVVLQYVINK
jgi:AGZA family xanthine/uracil permease-like MFS transporter